MADPAAVRPRLGTVPAWLPGVVRVLAVGTGFGVLAGASLFVHLQPGLITSLPPWTGGALLFSVGALVQIVVRDLKRGAGVSLVALVVAILVTALSYAAPLFALEYSSGASQLLLTLFLGRTAAAIFIVLPLTFYSGYLLTLVIDAYAVQG